MAIVAGCVVKQTNYHHYHHLLFVFEHVYGWHIHGESVLGEDVVKLTEQLCSASIVS